MTLGAFGGVAGVFALFFFSDIPRVRKDIITVNQLARMFVVFVANARGRKYRSLASTLLRKSPRLTT